MSEKDEKDEKRKLTKQWIGDLAAFLSILAYIPLVTHVTLSKETKSLHYYWLFIASIAALMWAMYGIYNGLTPHYNSRNNNSCFINCFNSNKNIL